MRAHWVTLLLIAFAAAGVPLSGQSQRDQRMAMVDAFKHVQQTLPKGPIAIESDKLPNHEADSVAARTGATARSRAGLFTCAGLAATTGPPNCELRGFVGTLGFERIVIAGDSATVVVWRREPIEHKGRSWIYNEQHYVHLKRGSSGWKVVRSRIGFVS